MCVGTIISLQRHGKSQYKYEVRFDADSQDARGKTIKLGTAKDVQVSTLKALTASQRREGGPAPPDGLSVYVIMAKERNSLAC